MSGPVEISSYVDGKEKHIENSSVGGGVESDIKSRTEIGCVVYEIFAADVQTDVSSSFYNIVTTIVRDYVFAEDKLITLVE